MNFFDASLIYLLLYLVFCLFRSYDIWPKLMKSIHIKGQIVKMPFIISNRTIDKRTEVHELINEIPHLTVTCMEYMCTIFMYIDTTDVFASNITTDYITLVYDKNFFTSLFHQVGISGSIYTGTDN